MKKYIKPECEDINVASQEVMTTGMSVRIFDNNLSTIEGNGLLITDGSEILENEGKVWDSLEDNLNP